MTIGVLGAEVSGPAVFRWLLRGSFGLVVGGILLWTGAIAVRSLVGLPVPSAPAAAASTSLPEFLRHLCPACGHTQGDELWCFACEFPLKDRAEVWKLEARDWLVNLIATSMGAGLLCIGVFLMIG